MPKPKAGGGKNVSPGRGRSKSPTKAAAAAAASSSPNSGNKKPRDVDLPKPAGYMVACDVPTKQFIQYLNVLKEPADKKFVLKDLDATHLLIKQKAKEEILRKVEDWENSNVYSAIEKVGEDFDMS